MADHPNLENEEFDGQDSVDIIELTDQDGVTTQFEHLATFPFKGQTYLAVCEPTEEEDPEDLEVFLLRVEEDENGEEMYVTADDADTDEAFEYFLQLAEKGEFEGLENDAED